MAKSQRLGILGGTFDPVHLGHIRLGQAVLDAGYVDRLLIMPSGAPPHKACAAKPSDRWKMVVSACACDDRLVPSALELERSGSVFTADTLAALKQDWPGAELFFLLGTDVLMTLRRWRRLEEVLQACTFLVCSRENGMEESAVSEIQRLSAAGGRFITVPVQALPVSSTQIRTALASGKIPEGLDVSVLEYCMCKGLYGFPGRLDHIDDWIGRLFSDLKPGRFAHSLSVAFTAKRLAGLHGLDPLKAEQAGLLHDCAKCLPADEMRRIAVEQSLTDDQAFLDSTALLHSLVGARVAQDLYGMDDPEVLEAIRYHNTGHAGMSRLAMCVCLADSIEPLRRAYPLLDRIRTLADQSLEQALLLSLETTADYVTARGLYLHPRTRDTITWLKSLPAVTGPI